MGAYKFGCCNQNRCLYLRGAFLCRYTYIPILWYGTCISLQLYFSVKRCWDGALYIYLTFIPSLPCLHTFWLAIPTSFCISIVLSTVYINYTYKLHHTSAVPIYQYCNISLHKQARYDIDSKLRILIYRDTGSKVGLGGLCWDNF